MSSGTTIKSARQSGGGMSLPGLSGLSCDDNKRRRVPPPACDKELRYKDGEAVNVDSNARVQGGSAKFARAVADEIPIGPIGKSEIPTTAEQIRRLRPFTQPSWETVLDELYSNRQSSTTPTKSPDEEEQQRQRSDNRAFVRRSGNQERPQFYLLTVSEEATLAHIQPDGDFWNLVEDNRADPVVGDVCFTDGFLWTNPSPRWAWKSDDNSDRLIRVRVDIPAHTQVVIDRAPVYGGSPCQFDPKRESLFPDVLLGPAEFCVTEVVRYRSDKASTSRTGPDGDDDDGTTMHESSVRYVAPRQRGRANDELEYAQLRVAESDEFMDVRVRLVQQVKLPPPVGDVRRLD